VVEITIGQMESGKRVQRLVRQMLPRVPLSGIYKMVRTGRVKLNGKRAKADDIVSVGDVIRLYMAEADYEQVSKQEKKFSGMDSNIEVIYEDNEMIVVNKPAGLLTHGTKDEHKETLVNQVLAYLHRKGQLESKRFSPSPVHRLDRNTSGLVIFAKSGEIIRSLSMNIHGHQIEKWYLAIVKGVVASSGEVTASLDRENGIRTVVDTEGKPSTTIYTPLVSRDGTTVVQIQLVSGRTHQIRAHFSYIGHPLLGDVKYGGGRPIKDSHEVHQWLHAWKIKIPDGRNLVAPIPVPFREKLQQLGYNQSDIQKIDASLQVDSATFGSN